MKRVQQLLGVVFALALMLAVVAMAADNSATNTASNTSSKMAMTMDPVKVAPDVFRVVFDNQSVRVLELDLKPGAKVPTFTMGDHTVYMETDGKMRVTNADGKTQEVEGTTGQVLWIPGVTK